MQGLRVVQIHVTEELLRGVLLSPMATLLHNARVTDKILVQVPLLMNIVPVWVMEVGLVQTIPLILGVTAMPCLVEVVPATLLKRGLLAGHKRRNLVLATLLKRELIAGHKRRELVQTTPTRERLAVMLRQQAFALRVPANVIRLMFGTTLTGRCNKFAGCNARQVLNPGHPRLPGAVFMASNT